MCCNVCRLCDVRALALLPVLSLCRLHDGVCLSLSVRVCCGFVGTNRFGLFVVLLCLAENAGCLWRDCVCVRAEQTENQKASVVFLEFLKIGGTVSASRYSMEFAGHAGTKTRNNVRDKGYMCTFPQWTHPTQRSDANGLSVSPLQPGDLCILALQQPTCSHTRVVVVIIILLWQCIDRNPATIIGTTTFLPSFVLTPSFDFTDNSNHGSNKICLHDDLSSPCRPMLSFVGGIRVGLFGRTDAHVH